MRVCTFDSARLGFLFSSLRFYFFSCFMRALYNRFESARGLPDHCGHLSVGGPWLINNDPGACRYDRAAPEELLKRQSH